jgi:hypothetical protein
MLPPPTTPLRIPFSQGQDLLTYLKVGICLRLQNGRAAILLLSEAATTHYRISRQIRSMRAPVLELLLSGVQ